MGPRGALGGSPGTDSIGAADMVAVGSRLEVMGGVGARSGSDPAAVATGGAGGPATIGDTKGDPALPSPPLLPPPPPRLCRPMGPRPARATRGRGGSCATGIWGEWGLGELDPAVLPHPPPDCAGPKGFTPPEASRCRPAGTTAPCAA
jgi:hypothetical protein